VAAFEDKRPFGPCGQSTSARWQPQQVDGIVDDANLFPRNAEFVHQHFRIDVVDGDMLDDLRQGTRKVLPVPPLLRYLHGGDIGKPRYQGHQIVLAVSEQNVRLVSHEGGIGNDGYAGLPHFLRERARDQGEERDLVTAGLEPKRPVARIDLSAAQVNHRRVEDDDPHFSYQRDDYSRRIASTTGRT
jgi:hypothetical protein